MNPKQNPDSPQPEPGRRALDERPAVTRARQQLDALAPESNLRIGLAFDNYRSQPPRVDTTRLPAHLAAKYQQRRAAELHDLQQPHPINHRFIDHPVILIGVGLIAVVSMIAGVELLGLAAGAALLVAISWEISPRDTRKARAFKFSSAEQEQLDAATITWPNLPTAGTPTGTTLKFRDGSATQKWPEARAIGIAHLIADNIQSTRAWKSAEVDTARIDLAHTLADIELRAWRIWKIRQQIDTITNTSSGRPVAELDASNAAIEQAADAAWTTLVDLIATLDTYRATLQPIDELLADLDAIELSARIVDSDDIRQLHIDAAGNELEAALIASRTAELLDIREALTTRVDTLNQLAQTLTRTLRS